MKKFFLWALAAWAAVSCSTSNVESPSGAGRVLRVKLVPEETASTRAVGNHVGAEKPVLRSGIIYFITATGAIQSYVSILGKPVNAPYDPVHKSVGANVAASGFTVQNVPGSVARVYVIGNYPIGLLPIDGNISTFNLVSTIDVNTQFNPNQANVDDVTLQGSANLTGTAPNLSATVPVRPICARLEIGRLTAKGRIKSFKLDGIYINNFHQTMGIEGLNASEEVFLGPDQKDQYGEATNATYPLEGPLAEWRDDAFVPYTIPGIGYAPPVPVTGVSVWGFNVLAPQAAANNVALPHVIIKIKDVVVVDDHGTPNDPSDDTDDAVTYGGEKWLTIRNYYKTGSSVPLARVEQGNVYRIGDPGQADEGDVTFTEDDLTDDPELATINVQVTANIMTWIPNEVGYDFN